MGIALGIIGDVLPYRRPKGNRIGVSLKLNKVANSPKANIIRPNIIIQC